MNLTNHFLVAMPTMQDPQFKQSVIYLCEHNNEGAMGIIINQPIDISIADMLEQIEIERKLPVADPISLESLGLNGGPVSEDRGFVLHTTKGEYSSSLPVNNELAVTTSLDILSELGTAQAPNQFLVALGYAGWDAVNWSKSWLITIGSPLKQMTPLFFPLLSTNVGIKQLKNLALHQQTFL